MKSQAGFTLLELLVVLAILGMLAALAAPRVMGLLGGARVDAASIQLGNLATSLDLFRLENGRYPTEQEGITALVERPSGLSSWSGPYVKRKDSLLDPWGRPYLYRYPGKHGEYDLFTLGADSREGGDGENGDVTNW